MVARGLAWNAFMRALLLISEVYTGYAMRRVKLSGFRDRAHGPF